MRYVLPAVLTLAACAAASVPVYLKPGVDRAQARADLAACRADAGTGSPSVLGGGITVGIGVGVRRCSGNVCIGASNDPFDDITQRRRAEARGRAEGACMGAKGYALVELPACRGTVRILASHPFDTAGACVRDGEVAVAVAH
ncbi:hypothetical protein [Jannaschia sp. LMIT008]|uniref:hypothetical protein n=1 Tax=Jannaschia maritima TaxID=3032585 RepID=UPI002812044B|nr:hypothetical protein [Jannaschia sp. LMIT008]